MGHKLSIITAIHNALPMNRLFWKALVENTQTDFELVLIDNHSTDGSEHFFYELSRVPRHSIRYVRNEFNQSYAASQNQGIRNATHDILCFLNNDIWMPKGWELPFIEKIETNPLLVLSPSGQEAQPTQSLSQNLKRKWKHILFLSKIWRQVLGKTEEERLWKALHWMYGDLDHFKNPTPKGMSLSMNGIKGDSVIFHRKILERFPEVWDEEVPASDWHLYLTIANAHEKDPSIPIPQVLLNTYIHHFGRYSARLQYEPIANPKKEKSIEEIWGEKIKELWWGYTLPLK